MIPFYMHIHVLMQMDGMKKAVILLIIGALFMHSMIHMQSDTTYVKADSTLPKFYVDDDFNETTPGWQIDHFDRIQDAINAATEGDRIITYEGTYEENIIINKSISLFGEDVDTVIIDGGSEGSVVTITATEVDFSTFTIQHSGSNATDAGIKLVSSSGSCQIVENKITDCVYGLYVTRCHNTVFSQNHIFETTNATFFISSDENTIEYNTVYDNEQHGIFLNQTCTDNTIQHNTVYGNGWYGIYLNDNCSGNTVSDNEVYENDNTGIRIEDGVTNTNITDNEVVENLNYGIFVVGSTTFISDNFVCENGKHGIFLFADDETTVKSNNASFNGLDGIRLQNSTSANITKNRITSNERHGLYVNFYCLNNQMYNNYFSGNELNAKDISPESNENEWFHSNLSISNIIFGPIIAGNYWADYTGTDEDRDGFGDEPYFIEGGSKFDLYPLIHRRPIASAGGPYSGSVFEIITFDASESTDVNESMNLSYRWTVEEVSIGSGESIEYEFDTPGNYSVSVTVENDHGGTDTDTTYIIITPDELPPTIEIITHELVVTDASTLFTIKAVVTDNVLVQNVTLFYWTTNISSQQIAVMNEESSNVYEKTIIISSSTPSVHCIVTATDASENLIDTTNPFALFSCDTIVNVSQTIEFDASDSFDLDGSITMYSWDFGDGITKTGVKTSHKFTADGKYDVTLTVTDNDGNFHSKTHQITVQPSIPTYTSNETLTEINDEDIVSQDLSELFMAYDTDGDGILDMFVDPNGELKLVSVVTIDGKISFLLSIDDSVVPELFWVPSTDSIDWITKESISVLEDDVSIDYSTEEATMSFTVDRSDWLWLEIPDTLYPAAAIKSIKDGTNNEFVSLDLMFRTNDMIYVLDDDASKYSLVFENIFPTVEASFNPGDSGVIDEYEKVITISYNVPVDISFATFNGVIVTDQIKIKDEEGKVYSYQPPGYYENGTYSFSIDVNAVHGNKVSSDTVTYFYFQYELPPQPSFIEQYGLMLVLIGLVLGGGLFYGVCRYKGFSFDSYVYLKNRRLFPFIKPVIFGPMSVTVEKQNVSKAEFYVDGSLKGTISEEPFVWQWNERGFLNHSVEAKVFDTNGDSVSSGEMSVFIINPFKWNPLSSATESSNEPKMGK